MGTKEKIAIVGLIITALGLIPFSGIMTLIITPDFSAQIDYFVDSQNRSHQGIQIDNVGLKQAKNAIAIISASYPLKVHESQCTEGQIFNDNTTQVTIKFERFSQNIHCDVDFFSQYSLNIFKVEVTADDAQGYTWHYGQENVQLGIQYTIVSLVTLIVVFTIIYMRKKSKDTKNIIAIVGGDPSPLKMELIKKHGMGFEDEDEIILRAITP